MDVPTREPELVVERDGLRAAVYRIDFRAGLWTRLAMLRARLWSRLGVGSRAAQGDAGGDPSDSRIAVAGGVGGADAGAAR